MASFDFYKAMPNLQPSGKAVIEWLESLTGNDVYMFPGVGLDNLYAAWDSVGSTNAVAPDFIGAGSTAWQQFCPIDDYTYGFTDKPADYIGRFQNTGVPGGLNNPAGDPRPINELEEVHWRGPGVKRLWDYTTVPPIGAPVLFVHKDLYTGGDLLNNNRCLPTPNTVANRARMPKTYWYRTIMGLQSSSKNWYYVPNSSLNMPRYYMGMRGAQTESYPSDYWKLVSRMTLATLGFLFNGHLRSLNLGRVQLPISLLPVGGPGGPDMPKNTLPYKQNVIPQ